MDDPNQSLFSLRINENTKIQLRGVAVVAGVAAIFALSTAVLKLIVAIMNRNKTTIKYNYEGFGQSGMAVEKGENIAGAIFWLIISILLFYFLNRFSSQVKTGLNGNNQHSINSGLGGLAGYFITIGILVIILLVLVLIAIAGAGAGSR